MAKENKQRPIIAVDDGFDEIKVATCSKNGIVVYSVPSWIQSKSSFTSVSGEDAGAWYEAGADRWVVDPSGRAENTRFDGFHGSSMNRCLVLHAIAHGVKNGLLSPDDVKSADIVLGLPVNQYFHRTGKVTARVADKRKLFSEQPAHALGLNPIAVTDAKYFISVQAASAWVDFVLDAQGNVISNRDSMRVAIVDVGGNTTDVALVHRSAIDHACSDSKELGVFTVQAELNKLLSQRYGAESGLPPQFLRNALMTKSVTFFGERHDITDLVDTVREGLSHDVIKFLQTLLRSETGISQIDAVVLTGGGSGLLNFAALKSAFPQLQAPTDDARFANARGMLKYQLFVHNPQQALSVAA